MAVTGTHPLPDALLLMGRHCPYCPTVRDALQALQMDGEIGTLETIVIEEHPEIANKYGVRSVPWVRIGPFDLPGLRSQDELRDWARKAGSPAGLADYLDELLSTGAIDKGRALVRDENGMQALLALFANPETQLNTRIGISAIMESLDTDRFNARVFNTLEQLTHHENPGIRGDACHFLSLAGSRASIGVIRPLLDDADPGVREIARDSLAVLEGQA